MIGTINITIIFVTIVITITITISTVHLFIEGTVIADKSFATLATQSRPWALKTPGQNDDDGEEMEEEDDTDDEDEDDVDYDCNDNVTCTPPSQLPPHIGLDKLPESKRFRTRLEDIMGHDHNHHQIGWKYDNNNMSHDITWWTNASVRGLIASPSVAAIVWTRVR